MSSYQDIKTMRVQPLAKEKELSHQILMYAKEHGFTTTNIRNVVKHVVEFMDDNAILMDDCTNHQNSLKEFYSSPDCGRAIVGEKRKYFVCPACGRVLCQEEDLLAFDDNYCGNCGAELASAKKEALALAKEEN